MAEMEKRFSTDTQPFAGIFPQGEDACKGTDEKGTLFP